MPRSATRACDDELLDVLEEGVIWLDARDRVRRVNAALARMAERAPEQLIGLSLSALLSDPDGEPLAERLGMETARLRVSSGALRPVSVRLAASDLLVVCDRARETRLEREVWRSRQPPRRAEPCALLEHEIRTASTVIGGYLRLMQGGRAGALPEAIREFVALAIREVEHLDRLSEELLDLSSERGAAELRVVRKPGRLGHVVAAAVRSLLPLAAQHRVGIELEADPEDRPLSIDAARMEELVRNLLTNALRASPRDGRVRVVTELVESDGGAAMHLSVIDEGPGIGPADAERIFEPFVRLRGGEGRGLGLALCRRVAEAHGGAIHAETGGRGGHLRVILPIGQE